jgi:hypothetical protein
MILWDYCGRRRRMKYRIAIWAGVGFLVAGFWALYFFPTASDIIANQPAMWALARVSCPIMLASLYFGFAISVYWVLFANAITYSLIGATVETLRHKLHPAA